MAEFEFILFDLGGVLVELSGADNLVKWMDNRVTQEEMHQIWLYSESVRAFESGKITSIDFADKIVQELNFNINPEEFLKSFSQFPIGLFAGAEDLLLGLREHYPIGCLSNTNVIHWEWMKQHTNLEQLLHKCLLSFRMGLMKPDWEIFVQAAEELGHKPQHILFFDDNPTNVSAALAVGIQAYFVKGFEDLKGYVSELGLLGRS